jgi:hypothetical protein
MAGAMDVYTESGAKRAFAGALEWPGWCRSGRRDDDALDALVACAPRYAAAIAGDVRGFDAPRSVSDLTVVERLAGDATTDFGAPSAVPSADARPFGPRELQRLLPILEASWNAFDAIAVGATGKELRKGPRGGGRELGGIVDHVIGAESSYVASLGVRRPRTEGLDARDAAEEERRAVREALTRAVEEGLPEKGPRGGKIWPARYFVRRAAWHVLDHAWEIEDRVGRSG